MAISEFQRGGTADTMRKPLPWRVTPVPGYIDRFTLVVSPRIVTRTATSKMRSEARRRTKGWSK